jgi:DNA repair protein RecO (recombination protein O)
MQLRASSILLASRQHGETAAIGRFLTRDYGLVAGYVAGARGRQLRPVMIPGNRVEIDLRAKSDSQLPFAKVELLESRGPWLSEPLPAAAISWVCALSASVLPERYPYEHVFDALDAVLGAVCQAPSARAWLPVLVGYETLLLRELGYGGDQPVQSEDLPQTLAQFDHLEGALARNLLADKRGDVMAARHLLRERLARMIG